MEDIDLYEYQDLNRLTTRYRITKIRYSAFRGITNGYTGSCYYISNQIELEVIGTIFSWCNTTDLGTGYSDNTETTILTRNCMTHCWGNGCHTFNSLSNDIFNTDSSVSQCPYDRQGANHVIYQNTKNILRVSALNVSHCNTNGHSALTPSIAKVGDIQMINVANNRLNIVMEIGYNHVDVNRSNFVGNYEFESNYDMFHMYKDTSSLNVKESIFISNKYIKPYARSVTFDNCVFYECSFNMPGFTTNVAVPRTAYTYKYLEDWGCITNPKEISITFTRRKESSK